MKKNQNRQYTLAKVLAGVGAAALLGSAAAAASAWLRGRRAEQKPQLRPVQRKPRKRSRGFSLAEVLLVVGIIAILAGVTTVSVFHYQRDSHRLEMDSVAREIFVAAQNHLIEAKGQGYLGKGEGKGIQENDTGYYYFVVGDGDGSYESPDSLSARNTLLSLMLPYASVEENIRLGGSYIIRYDPESAAIQDVFYAEKDGKAFGHTFRVADYTADLLALAGDEKKSARRNVSRFGGAVVGWYGGTEQAGNPETKPIELKKPQIILHNEDTLWLEVRDYNTLAAVQELGGGDKAGDIVSALQRKVIVTGELSKTSSLPKFPGMTTGTDGTDEYGAYKGYRFTLDDITVEGKHFQEQFAALFPGETITVTVRIDCTYTGVPVIGADSMNAPITNSLFDTGSVVKRSDEDKALISYIRHLENLDPDVSGLDDGIKAKLLCAEQTKDLYWKDRGTNEGFLSNTAARTITTVTGSSRSDGKEGSFLPVNPESGMKYLGQGFTIWDVEVDTSENTNEANTGLFGKLIYCTVLDLNLLNINIRGAGNAGAVSGSAENTKFGNIAVYNDNAKNGLSTAKYTGFGSAGTLPVLWIGERGIFGGLTNRDPASAWPASVNGEPYVAGKVSGGLVGSMVGGSVNFCSASVYVRAGGSSGDTVIAGGLVGSASDALIQGSYSGGHTYKGEYNNDWNVEAVGNGSIAGGLVGYASGLTVEKSYNTSSVKGYTVAAGGFTGGFIGKADSNTKVKDTYTTGRVYQEENAAEDYVDPYAIGLTNAHIQGNNRYIITFKVDTESGTERAMSKYDRENPVNSEWEEQAYTGCVGIRPEQWNDAANAGFFLEDKALANPYDTELTYEYFFPSIEQLYGGKDVFDGVYKDIIKVLYGYTEDNNGDDEVIKVVPPKSAKVHYGDWYVPIPVAMETKWKNADTLALEINYSDYMDENGFPPETILVAVTGKESGKTRVFQLYTNLTDASNPSYQVEKEGYLKADGSVQWVGSTENNVLTPHVRSGLNAFVATDKDTKKITLTFDDIRTENTRFNALMCSGTVDSVNTNNPENALANQNFIPGENLTARVSLMPTWSDLKKETGYVTNSLFDYKAGCLSDPLKQTGEKTAYITNLRHLQNLDRTISALGKKRVVTDDGVKYEYLVGNGDTLHAIQTEDLTWEGFWSSSKYHYRPVSMSYTPVENEPIAYTLNYAGGNHAIDGVPISANDFSDSGIVNAGIFDTLAEDDSVTGLELVDIAATATGSGSAGALAGTSSGTVTGVLVRSNGNKAITASGGAAGGLIGHMTGGKVEECAAAVTVKCTDSTNITTLTGYAGGLIGKADNSASAPQVLNSYSGGRTTSQNPGRYYTVNSGVRTYTYNIQGGTAGGLIGSASGVTVENTYSTCSVKGSTLSGGLIGTVVNGSVSNSYAVGPVGGTGTGTTKGAFMGSVDGTTIIGKNYYFELANENTPDMPSIGSGTRTGTGSVTAIDSDLNTYNAFVYPRTEAGETKEAAHSVPYNNTSGSVPPWHFPSVKQLGGITGTDTVYPWSESHNGDWPVYETLVPNTKAGG